MSTRIGSALALGLLAVLSGCGAPEAEFSWNARTLDLLPEAKSEVQTAVLDHFGTPSNVIVWRRLPIAFGGAPGLVEDVVTDNDGNLVTGLKINFQAPAMIVNYDRDLDGQLTLGEIPDELQKLLAVKDGDNTLLEQANANGDNVLAIDELQTVADQLPAKWQELIAGTASAVTQDNAGELVGQELIFLNGNYEQNQLKIQSVDPETGTVGILPPLEVAPDAGGSPVQVIAGFGRTMRSGRHLYQRHCMHCHGVTGDGNGPTAEYLNPLPRDYRQGKFKFKSTLRNDRPQYEDLYRVVQLGIPGTYMPSFSMLSEQDLADVVEYVRWLSMRGEYEINLNVLLEESFSNKALNLRIRQEIESYEAALERDPENPPEKVTEASIRQEVEAELKDALTTFAEDQDGVGDELAEKWQVSERFASQIFPKIPKTPDSHASRARGHVLYLEKCAICHGTTGIGNGPQTLDYGQDPITKENYPGPGLFDDWGQSISPRDLTIGIYRGGRRPLDIYRRVHQGIPGTPMASFATFSDEQIWDIVNFVLSLPYPEESESLPAANAPVARQGDTPATNVARATKSKAKVGE